MSKNFDGLGVSLSVTSRAPCIVLEAPFNGANQCQSANAGGNRQTTAPSSAPAATAHRGIETACSSRASAAQRRTRERRRPFARCNT
jgi:hypothetical protein